MAHLALCLRSFVHRSMFSLNLLVDFQPKMLLKHVETWFKTSFEWSCQDIAQPDWVPRPIFEAGKASPGGDDRKFRLGLSNAGQIRDPTAQQNWAKTQTDWCTTPTSSSLRPALSWEICRCWRRILLLGALGRVTRVEKIGFWNDTCSQMDGSVPWNSFAFKTLQIWLGKSIETIKKGYSK